jgi:DNA replicative helicase MCM subunit Mcm2 (Cdc46/Mcm family)
MIQEPMDEVSGSNPITFDCELIDNDVRQVNLGDEVELIGIFRSRLNDKKKLNDIVIQTVSVNKINHTMECELDDISDFEQMIKNNTLERTLIDSYAPSVAQEDLAKTACLLTILGGVDIDTKEISLRGVINTFLLGDPGMAKSQLLSYITTIIPKSDYVNGAISSGPGMTVGLQEINGRKMPVAGPLSLCHDSVVSLDEISTVKGEDLSYLLQSLEDGKIKFLKGGYNLTLNAKTAVIAAANPKGYRYDDDLPPLDNIGLPDPLLTRFDIKINT